jgi:hypothetical protein
MPDESLPPGDKAVMAFLEIVAFALGWNGIDRLLDGKSLLTIIPILVASIAISYAGFKWPQIKAKLGPRFASPVDRIAGNRLYRRVIYAVIAIAIVASLSIGSYRYYHKPAIVAAPSAPQPTSPPIPISFRLGCEWGHIPIHIPAASTIHVIRVHPGVLLGNPNILDLGVFQDISSGATEAFDWPSKNDGRWMTFVEKKKMIEDKRGIPLSSTFKCELSSYGAVTLDEIVLTLLVDTPDGKRHSYPVAFDPLMSGHPFPFYVVSACSSGVIPTMIQWDDSANVRVLGEQKTRQVPLRYEKRNWPSQLLGFGGSGFVWNGLYDCQWNRPS